MELRGHNKCDFFNIVFGLVTYIIFHYKLLDFNAILLQGNL